MNSSHKRVIKNSHFLDNLIYLGKNTIPTSIEQIQYNKNHFSRKTIAPTVDIAKNIDPNSVNWFKISGISDVNLIYGICKSFGIQRFDIKDLISDQLVTKVISYNKSIFILMSCSSINSENKLDLEQVAFILTNNCVISIQEKEAPIFDDAIEAIKSATVQLTEKGCDYLLYILLRSINYCYTDSIIQINKIINELEDSLIAQDVDGIDIMKFIQERKKEYFLFKRIVSPMREEYVNLMHNTNHLISEDDMIYFNDFDDRLRIASEDIEALHEAIISLSDLYFNNNNMKMNEIIKKLTIVSTIFIPLTFMAGIWGMNFAAMPELKWKYGYLYAIISMVCVAFLAILYLRKKKWF